MNILFIGDVVGAPGRKAIRDKLYGIIREFSLDIVIANGENSASGLGMTRQTADDMFDQGVDIITMGNHTWSKSDIFNFIDDDKRVIRPANVSTAWPGRGYTTISVKGVKIAVLNLIGRVGMQPSDCPFVAADKLLEDIKDHEAPDIVILDFHAEATSEKNALARYLDGRISLLVGTHTHIQTADECILPEGTGYITDVGMTGPSNSVIGMEIASSVRRFTNKLPVPYRVADGPYVFSALFASIDDTSGRTVKIERIREF